MWKYLQALSSHRRSIDSRKSSVLGSGSNFYLNKALRIYRPAYGPSGTLKGQLTDSKNGDPFPRKTETKPSFYDDHGKLFKENEGWLMSSAQIRNWICSGRETPSTGTVAHPCGRASGHNPHQSEIPPTEERAKHPRISSISAWSAHASAAPVTVTKSSSTISMPGWARKESMVPPSES